MVNDDKPIPGDQMTWEGMVRRIKISLRYIEKTRHLIEAYDFPCGCDDCEEAYELLKELNVAEERKDDA